MPEFQYADHNDELTGALISQNYDEAYWGRGEERLLSASRAYVSRKFGHESLFGILEDLRRAAKKSAVFILELVESDLDLKYQIKTNHMVNFLTVLGLLLALAQVVLPCFS